MFERRAAAMGGGNFVLPVQTVTDFLDNKLSGKPLCWGWWHYWGLDIWSKYHGYHFYWFITHLVTVRPLYNNISV